MKKIIISLVAIAMSFGLVANAQIQNTGTSSDQEREGAKGFATSSELMRNGEIKVPVYPRLATSSEAVRAAVEKMQQERDAFKSKVEALKADAKKKKEQAKEELKTKLQSIKDEKKKATVQKLDENLSKINSDFITKWTAAVNKVDSSLSRIVEGVNAISASSTKDLTAVNKAISDANTAIAAAKTALEAQAKKVYSVTVTTEANLKTDVSSVRTTLNKDLNSVKDLVQAARLAAVKALTEYNKIK